MTVLLWLIGLFAFFYIVRIAPILAELHHRRRQGEELGFRITVASVALFILISLFTATLAVLARI